MKITIIGIGSVGSAVATAVAGTGLVSDMVLFDRDGIRARAAAEDLGHAVTSFNFDIKITAASDYRQIRGSEIVIIAAGANQRVGQTRNDLVAANADVIADVIPRVMANVDARNVKIIMVSNPLDVMVMCAQQISKLPPGRVIGTGTMLDTARFKTLLARHLGVSAASISAYVLGEHGDSGVCAWNPITVGGLALDNFCTQSKTSLTIAARKTIEYRVRNAAYEIIRGRGATWDGIAAVVADLLRCIINDENRILTVSIVQGQKKDSVAVSLPRIVGRNGAGAGLIPNLSSAESTNLYTSAKTIRKNFDSLK